MGDDVKLYISKEIEERAGIRAERSLSEKERGSWKADVISINRKKAVVFLNEQSGLVFFLYRPQERDYKHLADVFRLVLAENFKALGIPYTPQEEVKVYKGESKSSFSRIKERLVMYESYLSDDDMYLIYPAYLMNTRKVRGVSALESYLSSASLKMRDVAVLVKIKKEDGSKELSLMLPAAFTLASLKKCIDCIYGLDEEKRYDFIAYSSEEKYSVLEYYYRPEVFRAMDEELSSALKRKECSYALAKSTMLSTILGRYGELVYRNDFTSPTRFMVAFDSAMENLGMKSPMILSIKWADDGEINRRLKGITS